MNTLTITLQGTPLAKQRARKGMHGTWYNPQSKEMNITKNKIKESLPIEWIIIPKGIPVQCSIVSYFSFPKTTKKKELEPCLNKKDTDNIAKYLLDSMNKIIFHDDNQVYSLTIEKYYSHLERTEVTLTW
jgi:Holliday junction resolvase RusA-like endonuclease